MFLTACVMAVADMNGEDCAMIYSNYHGRDDSLKKNSVNCYVTPVPILLNCRDGRNPEEMMNDVKEQFEFGTAHCDYPSILDNKELLVNTVMFNYRNGTMNIGLFAKLCNEVYLCPKTKNQPNCLIIAGIVGQPGSDRLGFYCTYPEGVYSENAIQKFYGCYVKAIEKLKERVEK